MFLSRIKSHFKNAYSNLYICVQIHVSNLKKYWVNLIKRKYSKL